MTFSKETTGDIVDVGSLNGDLRKFECERATARRTRGALIGAGIGLIGGALIGGKRGALIGTGAGAVTGYLVQRHGNNRDRRYGRYYRPYRRY